MCFVALFVCILYPLGWMAAAVFPAASSPIFVASALLTCLLLALGVFYGRQKTFRRSVTCFIDRDPHVRRMVIGNFAFVAVASAALFMAITLGPDLLAKCAMALLGVLGSLSLGMAIGIVANRQFNHPARNLSPDPLMRIYEQSRNPNIIKTFAPFVFVGMPISAYAILVDPRLLCLSVVILADNLHTRVRMTIPIALFLLTRYEKSVPAWLAMKRASREYAIPSLVLDAAGHVPQSHKFHQDLVRVETDADWIRAVRLIAQYCPYIVIDTHSWSEALSRELELLCEPEFSDKTILAVRRDDADSRVMDTLHDLEDHLGRQVLMPIDGICHLLQQTRDAWMRSDWPREH